MLTPTVIAVHTGAGTHSERYYSDYNKIAKKACLAGIRCLKKGETALEACTAAVEVLENDPITNAGYGSNLTLNGHVENDASIMDGKTLLYGGCGAVKKLKNPIKLAYHLCREQKKDMPLGLVPPSLLVDRGALLYAKSIGLEIVKNKFLRGVKATKQYKKYKKIYLDYSNNEKPTEDLSLDTVGAVCIDQNGDVASACSSGGLILKRSGRVGQAALYASGTWADSYDKSEPSIAICTSGCGEYLVQTQFAKTIGDQLKDCNCPKKLSNIMTDNFINSRYLSNVSCPKLCGALMLRLEKDELALMWGHSTETMSIGYMQLGKKPQAFISELQNHAELGKSVTVGGKFFYCEG